MDEVEEVKSRLNIEDVIGEYVVLKRAGRNFRGLSPFSNEKTPSFMVSPEKQIWHDFSSGRGGTIFTFIMEMEGLDFKGALEHLARKASVDLEQFRGRTGSSSKLRERLYGALEAAAAFYQVSLTKNNQALRYVRESRGYTKETIINWRLGYAPNSEQGLYTYLTKKGFTLDELKRAGLVTQRYRSSSDMFRGRLMIPLTDAQGRVVGFTARLLADAPNSPKYINTPATMLYDKSRHIFGLYQAKTSIRKSSFVVVAEGNLDVISSHQAGVCQVVASAGTAMTERHLRELKRFTGDIRLCFDADRAGQEATERIIPIASKLGVNLGIIILEQAKDPDELIRSHPDKWVDAIQKPQYALDWLINYYGTKVNMASGQGKREFTDVLARFLRQIQDPVERDHYLDIVADKAGVHRQALQDKLQITLPATPKAKKVAAKTSEPPESNVAEGQAVDHLLSLSLMQIRLRDFLIDIKPEMILSSDARTVYEFLRENNSFSGDPKEAQGLHSVQDYVKILALVYEELYSGLEFNELRSEAARCKSRMIAVYVKKEKEQIAAQLANASDVEARKLLAKDKKLNALLKKSQKE